MKKVGFFQSIRLKFILIYVLLILVAMQIIGVYFVRELEKKLVDNFKESLTQRVELLAYNVIQEMEKERDENAVSLEDDIQGILHDFVSNDVKEVRVIDNKSRIIGTSNPYNQNFVGKRTTEIMVKRTLVVGSMYDKPYIDPNTGHRMHLYSIPIKSKGEVQGAIYLITSMESVYKQMRQINSIFASGTVIALVITAILGIFLAQTITRPMSDMRKQAIAMSKGNFSRKVKVYGFDEIGQLAVSFNNLARKLQEAHATTEGERRKLTSVLTHMTDGVIATDRKGRVILINEPALNLLNVPRETVMSKPILEVLGIEEEYSFESLLEDNDSHILDFSTRNKPLILRANFSAIQKETGLINGLITVLHDITEQEKIDQERREFVANVSHELRTPLTTMRSYLEALADGAWKDEQIAPKFLGVTQTETERMIRLVNDLLQLSRFDSHEARLDKTWVNFTDFFNHIIDRFEMTKEQHITFKRNFAKKAIFIQIDKDKITQVLDNIISNAIKYSPEGGKITFHVKENQNSIQVSISDEGVGIPKDKVKKIFERFYRVDKARSRSLGGTGLGLAIAKEMILLHGGNIWATSEEGKGTTIYFTLPLDEEEDEWL